MRAVKLISLALMILCVISQAARAQEEDLPRFEVGAQFSSLTYIEPVSGDEITSRAGFGGRLTYNFTKSIAAEAQVDFYPNEVRGFGSYTNGRAVQGLFGVKAGKRFDRFGIFGKARPGFIRYTATTTGFDRVPVPPDQFVPGGGEFARPRFGSRNEFALDLGGVLEFYPSKRIVTRFDLGSTIIRYAARTTEFTVVEGNPQTAVVRQFNQPAITTSNFQFSAGIGFRF